MLLTSLRTTPALIDQVHDRLLEALIDGALAPGARITQESVAEMLGVSRQPVSHALQILKRRGLLIEHGKRGLAVVPVDARRIRDLYQVRAALEVLAVGLIARRVAAGDLADSERREAERTLAKGVALGPSAPMGALVRADVAFHSMLHRLSGNIAIAETVAEQWPHFMRSMAVVLLDEAIRERVWREHAAILAAALAGKADEAQHLARDHIGHATEDTAVRLEQDKPPARTAGTR